MQNKQGRSPVASTGRDGFPVSNVQISDPLRISLIGLCNNLEACLRGNQETALWLRKPGGGHRGEKRSEDHGRGLGSATPAGTSCRPSLAFGLLVCEMAVGSCGSPFWESGASEEGWAERWPLCQSCPLLSSCLDPRVSLLLPTAKPRPWGLSDAAVARPGRGEGAPSGSSFLCCQQPPWPAAAAQPSALLPSRPRARIRAGPAALEQKDHRSIFSLRRAVASAGKRGCFDLQCAELKERPSLASARGRSL